MEYARALQELGWAIIVTPNLMNLFRKEGIAVQNVADFVRIKDGLPFPPTLHPKIEAALTLDEKDRIDLVYDIPYSLDAGNDVGGHTLLALAVKGRRMAVYEPLDMRRIIEALKQNAASQAIPQALQKELIEKCLLKISNHYLEVGKTQLGVEIDGLVGRSALELLNGENPYQQPSHLFASDADDDLALPRFELLSKEKPCYTNMADLDAILHCLCLCAEAFRLQFNRVPLIAVAAKHGNPCGLAVDWKDPAKCIQEALFGDPRAIWGGECIVNFPVTDDLAKLLFSSAAREKTLGRPYWMLDLVAAPDFSSKALDILRKGKNRKLFKNPALAEPAICRRPWHYRNVRGGFLRQPSYSYILDFSKIEEACASPVDSAFLESLIIAWSVAFGSFQGGNEVALVKGSRLISAGGGPSTVGAVDVALRRAEQNGHSTSNAVFAADASFPFTDVPELLHKAGCCGGIVPAGGKNFPLIKTYFTDHGMNVLYLPEEIRGFYRH